MEQLLCVVKRNTTLVCDSRVYLFSSNEELCYDFQPETVVAIFLYLMLLFCKVVNNHTSKQTIFFKNSRVKDIRRQVNLSKINNQHYFKKTILSSIYFLKCKRELIEKIFTQTCFSNNGMFCDNGSLVFKHTNNDCLKEINILNATKYHPA